ncbi:hypothetical protein KA005_30525, partial [bacterium]|nr:hypothetical protein [bacterium]
WRSGGLLDEEQEPKPAYFALQFLTDELIGATYFDQILKYDQVSGFEFTKGEKRIWVLWSTDEMPHIITLDQIPNIIFDKYGNQLDLSPNNEVQVMSPIYLEFSP